MPRTSHRFLNHGFLAAASASVCMALYAVVNSPDPRFRLSMSSGYTGLVLLVLTLAIGPIYALRGKRIAVSSDLRRDVGIWGCLWSVLHTAVGLQVHMRGMMSQYFFLPDKVSWLSAIRTDLFGFANYTGLLAVVLTVVLAMVSNDLCLRGLGAGRWKRIQQFNYVCFAAVIAHGILYQLIEKRAAPYAFALGFLAAVAVTLQFARAVNRIPSNDPSDT